MTNHPTGLYPVVKPRPRGTVYEAATDTRDLTAYYAAPPRWPLQRPDVTASIYLQHYVPRLAIVLPERTGEVPRVAELPAHLTEHRPPFGEPGRHRRPRRDGLRALIVAVAFVAIVLLPGVLG